MTPTVMPKTTLKIGRTGTLFESLATLTRVHVCGTCFCWRKERKAICSYFHSGLMESVKTGLYTDGHRISWNVVGMHCTEGRVVKVRLSETDEPQAVTVSP